MAGLFDTLGTASRGLQVIQRGLATVGNNIANVDTPSYSRQRSVLQAGPGQSDRTGTIGSGVEQITVERIIDRFVGDRLISETSRRSSLDVESSIYRGVESIVNEQQVGGLRTAMSRFFDALDDLASSGEPGQGVARSELLSAAEILVDTVGRYDSQLRSLQRDADRGVTGLLPEINALAGQIADLNGQITEAEAIAPANDLRDRRDQLLLDLAEKVEIDTLTDANGKLSVRIAGGLSLVDDRIANELVAVVDPSNPNPFDPGFSQVFYRSAGSPFDITSSLRGGELGGMIEARDNIIGGTIRDLDASIFTLTNSFNAVHQAGVGLVDAASYDFFADLSGQATVDDSARNFRLSADIDPDQGGSLRNIAAGAVAAPPPGGPGAAVGDTDGVEALKDLRTLRVATFLAGDAAGTPTGTAISVLGGLVNLAGNVGQNARSTNQALEQQEFVLAAAQNRRDSISGVSVDEEVADLVKLQANFQANARVISTVQSLLQDLFNAL
jgi:flagellar hook-associated protein 1 FlgK